MPSHRQTTPDGSPVYTTCLPHPWVTKCAIVWKYCPTASYCSHNLKTPKHPYSGGVLTPLRVMSVGLASPRQSLRQSVASFLPAAAVASGRQCFFSIACQWCCGCISFPPPPATPPSIPTNTARVLTACTNGRRVPPVSRSARAIAHPFAPRAALYGRPIASGSEAIGAPIEMGPQAIGAPIVKGPQAIGGPIGRSSPCSMRAR